MKKLFSLLLLLFIQTSLSATIRYVVSGNNTSYDGLSWFTANGNLQAMINASSSGDTVWVAAGTYKPNSYPSGCTSCTSSRDYTFSMKNGVRVFGGFNSFDSWGARDPRLKQTILDGNIGSTLTNSDNAYHVVLAVAVSFYQLDGFTIRNGNADIGTSVNVARNFTGYTISRDRGAGIYQENCGFTSIKNCDIHNNAASVGAGINLEDCEPTGTVMENSILRFNTASTYGGAIALFNSKIAARSSLFYLNEASSGGKAIDAFSTSNLETTFCTFYLNGPSSTASLINVESNSYLQVNASVLWDNYFNGSTSSLDISANSTVFMRNTITEGGYSPCSSCPNVDGDVDPEFRDSLNPPGLDNIYGTKDDGLVLQACSPGVDSPLLNGFYTIPSNDVTLQDRSNDYNLDNTETYDLGAYEKYVALANEKIYVNTNMVTGLDDGTSPSNAFRGSASLHNAILEAGTRCDPIDILIAQGTYKPRAYPANCTGCSSVSDYTFLLPPNANLIGGYNPSFTIRDTDTYPVSLDGNVGNLSDSSDNAHHILLTIEKQGRANKIKGVTFSNGGNPDHIAGTVTSTSIDVGSLTIPRSSGGAIYNRNAGTSLEYCIFENNHASGGVLYLYQNSNVYGNRFGDLIFRNNVTIPTPTGTGSHQVASVINGFESDFLLYESYFHNNTSTYPSAMYGFYLTSSNVNITRSRFYDNLGTLFSTSGAKFSIHTSLVHNQTGTILDISGGTDTTRVSHCNFVNPNTGYRPISVNAENVIVENSVLWNGSTTTSAISLYPSFTGVPPAVNNSIVKNGYNGCVNCPGGNGNIDPQFKNINSLFGEYDSSDNFDRSFDDGLRPQVTSPLIDAGTVDILYNDIVNSPIFGSNTDIGAYEGIPTGYCNNDMYLTDKTLPSGEFKAFEKIFTESHIGPTSEVEMGGEAIILLPGFEAKSGAVFEADPNNGCFGPF